MNTFLKNLGKAIVTTEGFLDRLSRRHNEALKRFNKLLASSPQYYFLLKESLTFTCEQMQLPREALREYKELEAIISVGSTRDGDTGGNLNPAAS